MITRRSLIRGMGALLAAPATVRITSIMPVQSLPVHSSYREGDLIRWYTGHVWRISYINPNGQPFAQLVSGPEMWSSLAPLEPAAKA